MEAMEVRLETLQAQLSQTQQQSLQGLESASAMLQGLQQGLARLGGRVDDMEEKLSTLAHASPSGELAIGDLVEVHGLQGAKELNGLRGEIVRLMAESSRYGVHLEGHVEPRALLPANLRKLKKP